MIETCYRHPNVTTGVHCTRCGRPICTDCMVSAPVGYQCPECVREVRGAWPRRRARLVLGRPGSVTTTLLAINIAVFVIEMVYGRLSPTNGDLFNLGALYPPAIAQGHQYWRLFTAMFLHAGFLHLALNMYALYLFGYLVESAFGWRQFLVIYFVSGLLASVTSFAFGPITELGVGASGAIVGVFGAWIAYNYRRRSNALALANLQWALVMIVLNALLPVFFHAVDWRAHVGGLLTGFIVAWLLEGVGPRAIQPFLRVCGIVAILGIGVVLTLSRASALA